MNPEPTDPVIDEIRAVRHSISERVGHDPACLVAYYLDLQQQLTARLIDSSGPAEGRVAPPSVRIAGETAA